MKNKILVLLLGLVVLSTPVWAISDPKDVGHKNQVTGQKQYEPYKEYQLVRVSAGIGSATFASADVVVWDTTSDDGVTIARTTTSADGAIAGILVTDIETADTSSLTARDDIGRRNWNWMQTYGPALAEISVGGTNLASAGDPFVTSTDAGAVCGLRDAAATSLATQVSVVDAAARGGFFLDTPGAADTQVEVFVQTQ